MASLQLSFVLQEDCWILQLAISSHTFYDCNCNIIALLHCLFFVCKTHTQMSRHFHAISHMRTTFRDNSTKWYNFCFCTTYEIAKKQDSQSPLIIRNRYHTYGKEYVINVTSKFEIA